MHKYIIKLLKTFKNGKMLYLPHNPTQPWGGCVCGLVVTVKIESHTSLKDSMTTVHEQQSMLLSCTLFLLFNTVVMR